MTIAVGIKLGPYEILERIGAGGMGEVWKARDTRLGRIVAIKKVKEQHSERFKQEARSIAALNHPNICQLHDIGPDYLVLEYVEGKPLSSPLAEQEAVKVAIQIATALEEAHLQGIIHRDLKPSNIMVTDRGAVKLLDFGLAKLYEQDASISNATTADYPATQAGAVIGTVAYMSPEQAQGQPADVRSDIFSFGLVLYELLSGRRAFTGDSNYRIMNALVKEEPPALHVCPSLKNILRRCLAKQPSERYQTASEFKTALEQVLEEMQSGDSGHAVDFKLLWRQARRARIFIPGLLILLALGGLAAWSVFRNMRTRWAREYALQEITRLVDSRNYSAAYALALQAERYVPADPQLVKLWPEMSARVTVHTSPPGADVYLKEYSAIKGEWQYLGRSPFEAVRIPMGYYRWKIEKTGFMSVHVANPASNAGQSRDINLTLYKEGGAPQAMVSVPAGSFSTLLVGIGFLGPVTLGDYWIDKFEVTNREFKKFVEQGGYQKQEYWKNAFVKDGRILTWKQAMVEFRDATGRPGPAFWQAGGYPSSQEDFPVTGVSWYEAAAYAEFAGKRLPTLYDWYKAARVAAAPYTIPVSNFGGNGPARVGEYQGVGPFGTYDMAGNVKEWCWNEDRGKRYILGGSWNQPSYLFSFSESRDPFDRSSLNGFRCVKYAKSGLSPALAASIPRQFRDFYKESPVSDEIFRVYESLYSYDWTELNPVIGSEDDTSPFWRAQKITFNAAYGNERIIAHLFLPKNKPAPFQTVIFFPGSNSVFERSSPAVYYVKSLDFLIKSGRAVLFPVYKGLYERGFDRWPGDATAIRDRMVQWRKDLGRSIDYLETRKDIDSQKLAYCGHSMGARTGIIILALEKRLKTAVLLDGGFPLGRMPADVPKPLPEPGTRQRDPLRMLPEADEINFAPRVKVPVLMLNGKYDFIFPVDTSQVPMFRTLGTPLHLKRHKILDTPHNVFTAGSDTIRIVLDWLDQYLGPVP